ncbi:MAG: hypothetical protein LBB81_04055 [Treponema sp.]|nr:hypothetical protein [Treponema sp.]
MIADGLPYSPGTVDELYKCYYGRYIAGDPFLDTDINGADVPSTRAFLARIGMKKARMAGKLPGAGCMK